MSLLWGFEIDLSYCLVGYFQYVIFYFIFFYELVWSLVGVVFLLWVDWCWMFDYGCLFMLYVVIYIFGCFWVEWLCIDLVYYVG